MRRTDPIIKWLMEGDVSIQYQVSRDLLHTDKKTVEALQQKIETHGWGAMFLKKQKQNGHWGISFYQPKWTCTHYTLQDLKTIGFPRGNEHVEKSVGMVLQQAEGKNGGINYAQTLSISDVCINGMILNFSSYYLPEHPRLQKIADFLLNVQMEDGGWNCRYYVKGTTHSSLHSTISVLEGLLEFRRSCAPYRTAEILKAEKGALQFLLNHQLYQSHRTGEIIDARMLRLSFPFRWRYDILRCLDHLRDAQADYDRRMKKALDIISARRKKDGKWPLQEKHKGAVHFDMEKTGAPSRWNTLRALRVLNYFEA